MMTLLPLWSIRSALASCAALLAAATLLSAPPLAAQQPPPPPPLLAAAAGDSVRLLLTVAPPPFGGFVVYRAEPGGQPERITPAPVRRIADPGLAAALFGHDLPLLLEALETDSEAALLRRLGSDDFAAHVLSIIFPSVAHVLGRHYVDRGAARGATYDYRVVFIDNRGRETGEAYGARVVVRDGQPAAPADVTARAGHGQITVDWRYRPFLSEPGDVVIGFHVYREGGASRGPVRLTRVPLLRNEQATGEFMDTTAVQEVEYRYHVRAVDLAGTLGPASASAPATLVDLTPLALPEGLITEPGDNRVDLAWRRSLDARVTGYHVERSLGLDQPYTRLTVRPLPVGSPFYADTTAIGGTPYFYRVVAVDRRGNESPPGNAILALPVDETPPEPPSRVTVEVRDRQAVVRWAASPSTDVNGYYVYRGADRDRLVRLVSQPVPATEFVDVGYDGRGLAPGGRYVIRVSAVDRSYNESEPVDAEVLVPDDEPPAPPTAFDARNRHGRYVELSWSASPSLDVAEYVLRRASPGASPVEVGRFAGRQRAVRDSAVERGVSYSYLLVAVDTAGNISEPASARVDFRDFTPPTAPRFAAARVAPEGVALWWERSASADLAGYHVYRSRLPTGVYERVTDRPVTALEYVDRTGSTDWFYTVRAVDRSGNESAASPAARPAS